MSLVSQLLSYVNRLSAELNSVRSEIPAAPVDASTTVKGIVELATNTETTTGTDTGRAVTPSGVAAALGSYKKVYVLDAAEARPVGVTVGDLIARRG